MNLKKKYKNSIRLFGALFFIMVLVFLLSVFYVNTLKTSMEEETAFYLSEVSRHVSEMIDYKIELTFQNMEFIAEKYSDFTREKLLEELKACVEQYHYHRMGYLDKSGVFISTTGEKVNISDQPYTKEVLSGKKVVTNLMLSPVDGREVIIYAVPVIQKEEVTGAILTSNTKANLQNILNAESFHGEGFSHIIDCDGSFIVRSLNKNAKIDRSNFFEYVEAYGVLEGYDLEQMKQDMKERKTGVLQFLLADGEVETLYYMPASVDNWYLLSVVPRKIAKKQVNGFASLALTIMVVISLLFCILIVIVVFSQRNGQKLLEQLAYRDPVTGGLNRLKFEEDAIAAIRKAAPGAYAMVSIDIKKFKLINDMSGSEEGNRLLRFLNRVLEDNLEKEELVSRASADNFYLLMKNRNQDQMFQWVENVAVRMNSFNEERVQKYYIGIVVGVYTIEDTSMDIIMIQDRANVARKNGKLSSQELLFSCAFYTDIERKQMLWEKEVNNRMSLALDNHEFVIYLQPKINVETEKIAGAEALVRWRDKERGIIPPNDYIPIFEKNKFIIRLDLYVFEEVCKIISKWLEDGITPIPVSVNLSRVHIENRNFLKLYRQIFEKYKIPANLIEIELTETVAFENMDRLKEVIDEIHEIGFLCSMDDFGSGYSSLNMLKDIKVDTLKLDKKFFDDEENTRGKDVVESVVHLARKLDMYTVAEGVESRTQVKFLKEVQCDYIQGYVFSRPLPVDEFEDFMKK